MKNKIVRLFLVLSLLSLLCTSIGCAGFSSWLNYKHTEMPAIELPKAPVKPAIKSHVIKTGNEVYIAYTIPDSMKLYEYLIKKDSYIDMLIYRIDQENKLIKEFGKARK